ncbi:Tyrosine recombinase XerC [uncultured Eubacterium sp.]|nr:Tyrosine recombinase XerC [uncultured Eubacterium sp.]
MDFEKYVALFLEYQKAMFHTEKTIQSYKEVLHGFVGFLQSNGIDVLCRNVFIDYQLFLGKKGLRSASVASYLRHIKAFVHWMGENAYLDDSDLYKVIKMPKQVKKNVKIYTDEEIAEIYSAVSSSSKWITVRDKAIISLMYDSGLRQAEVCKVSMADFDTSRCILHVHGKGNKDRIVPIGEMTKRYVMEYLELCPHDSSMLLVDRHGSPLTPNAVKLFVGKMKKKLNFEFSSHKLRHNFATNYLIDQYEEYGYFDTYSLMILLGHEEISTTDRYLHLAKQYIATNQRTSHLDRVFQKKGV